MVVRTIALIIAITALLGRAEAAPCAAKSDVRVGASGVGASCEVFSTNRCISVGQVYIKSDDSWILLDANRVTTPPTLKNQKFWNPDLQSTVQRDAYEFLYVADLRKSSRQTEVAGLVVARKVRGGDYKNVVLFRNIVGGKEPHVSSVNAKKYQVYIKTRKHSTVISEIDNWVSVPGYDSTGDTSLHFFEFTGGTEQSVFSKIAMKLRSKAGAVSCIPFQLAHNVRAKYLDVRAFIQRQLQIEEASAEFDCCSRR